MDVVDARADLVGIFVLLESLQQLGAGSRILDRDHVGVHALDDLQHIVEFAVAHVRVDLCGIAHARGREPEGIDRPLEVLRPIGAAQRQPFAQRRLVDLNHADPRGFQIQDLVADREGELLRGFGARLVVAHEGPLENRDRAGQHAFHRTFRERLRIPAPAYGHRIRP